MWCHDEQASLAEVPTPLGRCVFRQVVDRKSATTERVNIRKPFSCTELETQGTCSERRSVMKVSFSPDAIWRGGG